MKRLVGLVVLVMVMGWASFGAYIVQQDYRQTHKQIVSLVSEGKSLQNELRQVSTLASEVHTLQGELQRTTGAQTLIPTAHP